MAYVDVSRKVPSAPKRRTKRKNYKNQGRDLIRAKPSNPLPRLFCLNTIYCWPGRDPPEPSESKPLKRIHASTVKLVGLSADESWMTTEALVPSKWKAWPTSPEALAVAPPCRTP